MTPVKLFPQWKTLLLTMHKIPLSGLADAKGYLDADSQFKSRCHPFMRMNDSHFLAQPPSLASSIMTRCFLWEWKWPSNTSYPRLWVNVERFQSSFAFVFFPFHFFRNGWQGCFEDWHMALVLLSWDASCFWNVFPYLKREQLRVWSCANALGATRREVWSLQLFRLKYFFAKFPWFKISII